ncbi:hypothetical protein DM02DRAFT_664853 [Periconia macrospinosa]|uniref:Uncharacterized protein n=1 Tax=Periconia macrospinosa TaxID=97972 RepID=A0A2V1CZJ5_9PLEO|nr:hypothetical protein DM02DRAFT_664853 [Periconia macrospinosa]
MEDAEIGVELPISFVPDVTEITKEQDMGTQKASDQVEVESLTSGKVEGPIFQTRPHKASGANGLLFMEPLMEEKVCRIIFAAMMFKAPGNDGMLAVVWQELWEYCRGT